MDTKKLIGVGYSEMGEWWIADTPKNKQIGMLSIGDDKTITLSLYDRLGKQDDFESMFNKTPIDVTAIHGALRNGDNALLSDCIYIGGGKWIANVMLKGKNLCLLDSIDAYSFKKVTVLYSGLEEWVGWRFLPKEESFKPNEDGYMTLSDNLILQKRNLVSYILDDCTMEISYRWNFSQKDSNLTGLDYIVFTYENGKIYTDIMNRVNIFGDFLLLCMGVPVLADSIILKVNTDTENIYVYTKCTRIRNTNVERHKILSYGWLKDDLPTIINNWFSLNFAEETRDAVALYTESYEGGTAVEITFLILFQACEGLVKRIRPDICDKKTSARDILKHMLCTVKNHLPEAISDDKVLDNFTKKVNDTRNYWVHNSGGVKKANIYNKEIFVINALLRYALRAYLLVHTGVTSNAISSALGIQTILGSVSIAEIEAILNTQKADSMEENING